jgi:hypothetical protein
MSTARALTCSNPVPLGDPYAPYTGNKKIPIVEYQYGRAIVDPNATTDLADVHTRYYDWAWPDDL